MSQGRGSKPTNNRNTKSDKSKKGGAASRYKSKDKAEAPRKGKSDFKGKDRLEEEGKGKPTASQKPKTGGKPVKKYIKKGKQALPKFGDTTRLNKYIAHAGFCSRREADTLIASGVVTVNGLTITEMGFQVKEGDDVRFDGQKIKNEPKKYVLVNKPTDFSIQYDENPAKKSVYQLIKNAGSNSLVPIGKLDKVACGLILYTNDTDLVSKFTHPTVKVSQLFHVVLSRAITEEDLAKLTTGLFVDNKMFSAEEASFVTGKPQNEVGIRVFSTKSNIVKFMFGKLEYNIKKIDRVEYAGLTKLDLPRGTFRHLTEKEVGFLKMN